MCTWRQITCGRRHKSILDYFHAQGMTDSFAALMNESKVEFVPEPKTKYSGLLEKKWTSVIRLQKKVRGFISASRVRSFQDHLTTLFAYIQWYP